MVPPPQMVPNLNAGHLDGFCVGEPWNSVAVQARAGWCAAASAELAPGHPEKVLMVRRDFAENRAGEHVALLAALLEACAFCDASENHDLLIATLAKPEYVGAPESALRRGISGEFDFGNSTIRSVANFAVFHRDAANEPSQRKAAWVLQQMRKVIPGPDSAACDTALGRRIFREDIFEQALRLQSSSNRTPTSTPQLVH
jgi:ABC-type nitrate/sulfonate/bicarbonate transport system substrate-binding protein